MTNTHETYLAAVRDAVIELALERGNITSDEAAKLAGVKMLYGIGDGTYRGITVYQAWENGAGKVDVVEIAGTGEDSWIQLAGTVVHELGHVLGGWGAGHENAWKDLTIALGFVKRPAAAGQVYSLALFDPALRVTVYQLAKDLGDGSPAFRTVGISGAPLPTIPRPCSAGIGTRGGKSRGKGSGSRMRLWECECPKPVKVRVASDDFQAHCDKCGSAFARKLTKAEAA